MRTWKVALILAACAGIVGALEDPAHSQETTGTTLMQNIGFVAKADRRCGMFSLKPEVQAELDALLLGIALTSSDIAGIANGGKMFDDLVGQYGAAATCTTIMNLPEIRPYVNIHAEQEF